MEKRGLIIGTYNTAVWGWTLTSWSLSAPEYQENFLDVPGRDGALDLSAALTNGAPTYHSRTLTARLECSEESRLYREGLINNMINWLDGWRLDIELPDDDIRYITGRVSVKKEYSDNAHAAVTVTAICDPWRYIKEDTEYTLTAAAETQTAALTNHGRRRVVPLLEIAGDPATATSATVNNTGNFRDGPSVDNNVISKIQKGKEVTVLGAPEGLYTPVEYQGTRGYFHTPYLDFKASVLISFGSYSWSLGAGTYQLPDLTLPQGDAELTYSGTGTLRISYREAVL